jgi:nucleoside-triphosphatase THEP1
MPYTLRMSERRIYILTGEIQSGKTTALMQWAANRSDVFGIFTPVIDGTRFFIDAHTHSQFKMEADKSEKEVLSVGRFNFSKPSFEKAIKTIQDSMNEKGWLVIDEIGPLELRMDGFYEVINKSVKDHAGELVLVVRNNLVDKVVAFFGLKHSKIITGEQLEQL